MEKCWETCTTVCAYRIRTGASVKPAWPCGFYKPLEPTPLTAELLEPNIMFRKQERFFVPVAWLVKHCEFTGSRDKRKVDYTFSLDEQRQLQALLDAEKAPNAR